MIIQEILTAPSNDPREELDSILAELCELVLSNQEKDSEYYGMVGACVLGPEGQKVCRTSYQDNKKYVHAERAAIEAYGDISPECIVVTTLSPCNSPMNDRAGESCEDVIASYNIEHVYCGYKDPTQEGDDSIETKNSKLRELCKRLADTFLDEDYDPNGVPPGPETKPTMPAGTVRVDVSDVYDWYKLGTHIANLKGLGKHDFGKGPPSTIMSFGSEEEEHKYIDALKKTGLTTTDIDPVDPKQPKGMPRQKTDPTYNVAEARKKKRKSRGGYYVGYPWWGSSTDASDAGGGDGGMAEGSESYPEVLYHGSTQEIEGPLTPRQANDIGGHPGSNKNAIYATDDPNFAIAYSLAERGSDTGTFGWKKEPRLIFFGGKIRHGESVYIHVLPTKDDQGRPLFARGGADAEWYSVPGVKEVTPTEVKPLPVDQYLHLLRKPTPEEQKIFQANKAKQDIAENFHDGKVKGKSRPGRVKRAGASCSGSVTSLRKKAKNASGERAKMYHWCANMKSGKKK